MFTQKQGVGTATPNQQEGHQGSVSATATESRASQENRQVLELLNIWALCSIYVNWILFG